MANAPTRSEKNLQVIKEQLGGTIERDNGIHSLSIDNYSGKGIIRCIDFNKFMISMEIDLKPKENTIVSIGSAERNMIYFLYCLEGKCGHQFDIEGHPVEIEEI